jgi:O-antigen ligase
VIADVRELGVRSAGYGLGLNASARYFALSVGLLLYLSQRAERLPIKLLALAGAIYQFLGVVFIQSRSGILISLCAVVLMSTVGAKRKAARIALNATVVLLIAVAVLPDGAVSNVLLWFTPEAVIPREQLQGIDNNIRFHLWQAGWAVWRDSPITGVGIGGFAPAAQDYLDFRTQIEDLPPHNMFVGLLSETGIVGFLLFAVLIGGCMRRAWRAYKRSNPQRPDASAVWLIAVGLLIAGGLLKDETSEKLLWLALGAAASFRPARAAQRVRRVVRLVRRPAPLGRVPAPDTVSMARTIR